MMLKRSITRRATFMLSVVLSIYCIGFGVFQRSWLLILIGIVVLILGMVYLGKDGNQKNNELGENSFAPSSAVSHLVHGNRNRGHKVISI